jgi:hypothetical protein
MNCHICFAILVLGQQSKCILLSKILRASLAGGILVLFLWLSGEEVNRYTRETRLFIQQRGEHRTLVVCYKDIFDNLFESSREVRVDKERTCLKIDPLKIHKLPKGEHSSDQRSH